MLGQRPAAIKPHYRRVPPGPRTGAMRRLATLLIAFGCTAISGCFSIEQTMTFEKNLSGTAGVTMQVDLEPLVGFMVMMKHSMSDKPGTPGKPSEEEIAAARKELLASAGKSRTIDLEQERKLAESQLPAGVKLLDAAFKEDGLKLTAKLLLGFDHASKLEQIKFDKKPGAAAGGPLDNPMDDPLGGLKVIDEGKTFLVTSPAKNPMGDQKAEMEQMPMDAELKALVDSMMSGVRVAVRLTSPFEVVEHNAHRKEGNTLVWDYNYASLQKMSLAEVEQGIRVRYRK